MALVIQAVSMTGKLIEGARWEVESLCAFQKGQKVSVELPVKDSSLLGYLSKNMNNECMINGDKTQYSVVMSCLVSEVRHLVTTSDKNVDTMVIVSPMNRTVEHVLQYVLNPGKCDPRFMKAVRGDLTA